MEPEHLGVVADVADDGDVGRVDDIDETAQEPRAAEPPARTATFTPRVPDAQRREHAAFAGRRSARRRVRSCDRVDVVDEIRRVDERAGRERREARGAPGP